MHEGSEYLLLLMGPYLLIELKLHHRDGEILLLSVCLDDGVQLLSSFLQKADYLLH